MVKRIVMGIYDREYYRNEGPRYLDAFIPSGRVCKWLIGLNILFYILQLITKPTFLTFAMSRTSSNSIRCFKNAVPRDRLAADGHRPGVARPNLAAAHLCLPSFAKLMARTYSSICCACGCSAVKSSSCTAPRSLPLFISLPRLWGAWHLRDRHCSRSRHANAGGVGCRDRHYRDLCLALPSSNNSPVFLPAGTDLVACDISGQPGCFPSAGQNR